jgi:hypothetical protein
VSRGCRAALMIATLASACGGGSQVVVLPTAAGDAAFPAVYTTVAIVDFALAPGTARAIDLSLPMTDILYATIDWTDPSNNVVAAFTPRSCDNVNLALGGVCYGDLSSQVSVCPAKPRTLRWGLFRPYEARLWVANLGAGAESGVVQFTTCNDTPGCGAAAACAKCLEERPHPSCR